MYDALPLSPDDNTNGSISFHQGTNHVTHGFRLVTWFRKYFRLHTTFDAQTQIFLNNGRSGLFFLLVFVVVVIGGIAVMLWETSLLGGFSCVVHMHDSNSMVIAVIMLCEIIEQYHRVLTTVHTYEYQGVSIRFGVVRVAAL